MAEIADSKGFAKQQMITVGARMLESPNKLMQGAKTNRQANK